MVNTCAVTNSFHAARNANSAMTPRMGLMAGTMICQNTRNVPAPSMIAASSSSLGTLRTKPDTIKILAAWPPVSSSARPTILLVRPSACSRLYSGYSATEPTEMNMLHRYAAVSSFFPGKSRRAIT